MVLFILHDFIFYCKGNWERLHLTEFADALIRISYIKKSQPIQLNLTIMCLMKKVI